MDVVISTTSSEDASLLGIMDVFFLFRCTLSIVSVGASFVVESPWLPGIVEGIEFISSSACDDEVPRFSGTKGVISFPNVVVKPSGFSDLASDTPIVALIVVGILRVGATTELWCPFVIVEASGDIAVKSCVLVVARTVEVSCPGIVEASDVVSIESSVLVVGATVEV